MTEEEQRLKDLADAIKEALNDPNYKCSNGHVVPKINPYCLICKEFAKIKNP